ncbi:hypothetical protein C2S53_010180 [Perilla frutescens var. hirtella]|uniref:Retrotransposon gag domain-containing protein n=1 Tax=Perilla frutescens var. hirtella TaxID=608512 RepID=A0AAD4JB97_PERFH|nr:hypothetical protein C2S53_010180 [Perilla frutescens var. hirtella]
MESRDGYNKTHDKAPASSSSHTDAASSMPQPWDAQYHHQELEHKLDSSLAKMMAQFELIAARIPAPPPVQEQPIQPGGAAHQPEFNDHYDHDAEEDYGYYAEELEVEYDPYQRRDRPRLPYRQAPRRVDPDSLLNNIKTSIPEFEGLHDPDLYLDWERKVEKIFDCYDLPEQKKIKLASLEFRGYAASWWEMQQERRRCERYPPLKNKLNRIKQSTRSVEEYHKELETALNQVGKQETLNATIIRYIEGMNPDITCEFELKYFTSIEEMNQCLNRRVLFITEQNEIESASEDKDQPAVDAKKEPETPPVDLNEEEPELPYMVYDDFADTYIVKRDGRTTTLKPLSPKAVAEDQRIMQERFRAERAKEATAAVRIAANGTQSTETPKKAATPTFSAPKPSSNDSLVHGNSSGSAAKKDQNRSLFISVKGVEKALKAAMQGIEGLELELLFKGPMTRLRAKKLQGYLQVLIRKKFEELEDAKGSHILVNLLTNEDQDHTMENIT